MKQFKILQTQKQARVGELATPHGIIETPNFIPVGTKATVKALSPRDLKDIGAQVILANTYHLMLRPKADLIEQMGGLHRFMNWDKPIMTDSGGFQVFSLGVGLESGESKVFRQDLKHFKPQQKMRLATVNEKGVSFYSFLDGSKHFLTPETSIHIQMQLGADLIVVFDDHESITHNLQQLKASLELTKRWSLRSKIALSKYLSAHPKHPAPILYGVVHGGLNQKLRKLSAQFTDANFDAIAIGGIYGQKQDLYQIVKWVNDSVSPEKVKHLLGIGEVEDIFNAVLRGVDLFDCVAATRRARNGSIYILPKNGGCPGNNFVLNIQQAKFAKDPKPLDPGCFCYTCQNFSRSYLSYLYKVGELLYFSLATYHNVYFISTLMKNIRECLKSGQFEKLKKEWLGSQPLLN